MGNPGLQVTTRTERRRKDKAVVRRITPSQHRSQLRQAQTNQRQAIQKAQREIRQYEQKAKREIQQYNRNVKRAIDQHNSDVRAYNRQIEANRARIRHGLQQLGRVTVTARYTVIHSTALSLNETYARLQRQPRTAGLSEDYYAIIGYCRERSGARSDVDRGRDRALVNIRRLLNQRDPDSAALMSVDRNQSGKLQRQ